MRRTLEIVVPVYNEQLVLERSIRRLHEHARTALPDVDVRITIADNASTDLTPVLGRRLADGLDGVRFLRLERKGRGHALRTAWSASSADFVAYMDADLSTDLSGLAPLVQPLLDQRADLAIGSRLAPGAEVERCLKRELISRGYNRLLRLVLRVRFSDAQCGFKAARREPLLALLDQVEDESWFFDTELLYLSQCHGLRIFEQPVRWTEDRDSSVTLVTTAIANLRGIARLLRRRIRRGAGPAPCPGSRRTRGRREAGADTAPG